MAKGAPAAASVVEAQRRPYGISSAGMALSAALHAVLIAVAVTTAHRAMVEKEEEQRRQEELKLAPPEPFSFVPARLLRLGNQEQETAMPQREVPALPTAPPEPEVEPRLAPDPDSATPGPRRVRSANPLDLDPRRLERRPRRAAPDQAENLIWDRLRQDFPERGGWSRVQGHPDGDPEGTVLDRSQVRRGDWYATQLQQFLQDRWSVPNMISRQQLLRLEAKVCVTLDAALHVTTWEITKSSGNRLFDDAIESVYRDLKIRGPALPAAPSAIRDRMVADGFCTTWHGSDVVPPGR